MPGTVEVRHPLVRHHVARLRGVATDCDQFRQLVARLAVLLAYEATQDLSLEACEVESPLARTGGERLTSQVGLVPILRAGLGMVDPVLNLIPTAQVWHLGLYRDESTAQPVEYYSKLPKDRPVDVALVLDPMLATGGSATAALKTLQHWGVPCTKLLCILAAPEGIACLAAQAPETTIYVCAIDKCLNDRKFIVPGLGDAGDRMFNTLS